jgi:hypothetical protein
LSAEALAWSRTLLTKDGGEVAENAARRRCGFARQFFREAVQDGLLAANLSPIHRSKRPSTVHRLNGTGTSTSVEALAILEWCPNQHWWAIMALC